MAILDKACNSVVLRIIYAGAPLSGKTETIRSLSTLLLGERSSKGAVYSPEETHGRTLFFDWLDYKAGLFRGYKIRCQIISVPGQKSLQSRRQQLLKDADSVVFVLDSSQQDNEENKNFYQELQTTLQQEEEPAHILVQANKEDLTQHINEASIHAALGANSEQRVTNSIATEGKGIRESFIIAVNMAIKRAGHLMDNGKLPEGSPDIESGDDLLDSLKAQEQQAHNEQVETEIDLSIPDVADIDTSIHSLSTIIADQLVQTQQADSVSSTMQPEPESNIEPDIEASIISDEQDTLTDLMDLTDILSSDEHNAEQAEEKQTKEADNASISTEANSKIENPAEISSLTKIDNQTATTAPEPVNIKLPETTEIEDKINEPNPPPTIEGHKLAAGSIWPPVAGRIIFNDIQQKLPITITSTELGWQAEVAKTWHLYTHENFENQWKGRQHLIKTVHDYNHFSSLLSDQRCVFLADAADGKWWLWHVTKHPQDVAATLLRALDSKQISDIAQALYQASICFIQAHEKLNTLGYDTYLKLTDLTFKYNKAVFIGLINLLKTSALTEKMTLDDALYAQLKPLMNDTLESNELNIPLILNTLKQTQFNLNSSTLDMLNRLLIGH